MKLFLFKRVCGQQGGSAPNRSRWLQLSLVLIHIVVPAWLSESAISAQIASAQSPSVNAQSAASTRDASKKPLLVPRSEYLGDEACARCHEEKVESYDQTAHHLTSQLANKNTILGTFGPGENIMRTSKPNLRFLMEEKDNKFFETAVWGTPPNEKSRTHSLDLVIGSGHQGQSYLYWDDDQLFGLPVGYSTIMHRWINGPGYIDGTANFDRGIIPRCLECHAAYFESKFPSAASNVYNTVNFVLGISCERCHGPGRGHVQGQEQSTAANATAASAGRAIVNPAMLSRQRRAEICEQCHGGHGAPEVIAAFSYVPGEPLGSYISLADSSKEVDVHGHQGDMLARSKCFQVSPDMTCSTCHDIHKPEPDLAAISQRCLRCHNVEMTETHSKVGGTLTSNCVDCHMPVLASKVVSLDIDRKQIPARFRTHWIRIYTDEERK
jgi:Cytochrome c554 and c-prime